MKKKKLKMSTMSLLYSVMSLASHTKSQTISVHSILYKRAFLTAPAGLSPRRQCDNAIRTMIKK